MLDDYKIVNALDYPSSNVSSGKSINTNPNLADEELFSAKDSSYAVSKQLNTSLESNRTSLMLCNKLDNASSVVSVSRNRTIGKNESVDWDFLSRQSSQLTGVDSQTLASNRIFPIKSQSRIKMIGFL